jgi:TetR/AcrR family transcriptional regulator, transcriptional repressor for nem operon
VSLPGDNGGSGASRRRDKQESREALVRAAEELFVTDGFDGPSLSAICERAGYTRGVFYVHFKTREDLIIAVMESVIGRFLDGVIASGGDSADLETTVRQFTQAASLALVDLGASAAARAEDQDEPMLGVAFHRVLEACRRTPQIRRSFVLLVSEAAARMTDAARRAQQAERLRTDADAEQLATLLVLLALGVAVAADVQLPLDVERARDACLRLLARS